MKSDTSEQAVRSSRYFSVAEQPGKNRSETRRRGGEGMAVISEHYSVIGSPKTSDTGGDEKRS